jgi:hypothetical protein
MEMDLAPFYGTIFDPILIFYNLLLSSIGIYVWISNRSNWKRFGSGKVLLQSLAKCWLDTGLVVGIFLTAMGAMGLLYFGNKDLNSLYRIMPILLATFLWGGIVTGLGYCVRDVESKIDFSINPLPLAVALLILIFVFVSQGLATGIPLHEFFTNLTVAQYYFGPFILITSFSIRKKKHLSVVLADANLVATLAGMAMGISLWFIEGADYEASRDAIYLVANVLMLGSLSYLLIYLWSLLMNVTSHCNYQTKSWHFAEATAFFLFLVYAPVGTTEYLRESTDQANQQTNNEAQQLEINQLKAQIKLLTEKIGEL